MSDDTPNPEPAAEPTPVADAPSTTAVATIDSPAPNPEPVPAPGVADAPAPTATPAPAVAATEDPKVKKTVQVPVWLLVVVLGLAVVVGAFFVGRSTGSDAASGPDTLAEAVEMTASGEMELGRFDAATLLDALRQNDDLDLGFITDLLLDGLRNSGRG